MFGHMNSTCSVKSWYLSFVWMFPCFTSMASSTSVHATGRPASCTHLDVSFPSKSTVALAGASLGIDVCANAIPAHINTVHTIITTLLVFMVISLKLRSDCTPVSQMLSNDQANGL